MIITPLTPFERLALWAHNHAVGLSLQQESARRNAQTPDLAALKAQEEKRERKPIGRKMKRSGPKILARRKAKA